MPHVSFSGLSQAHGLEPLGGAERGLPEPLRGPVPELAGPKRAGAADVEAQAMADRVPLVPAFADRGVDIETTHLKLLFVCYFVLTNCS